MRLFFSLLQRLFLDPERSHEGGRHEGQGRDEGAHGGDLVAAADPLGLARGEAADALEAAADLLLDAAGLVAVGEAGGQLGAEDLLQGGGAQGDGDAGAQGAEEVGAGDGDGHVGGLGVRDERDQRRGHAGAGAQGLEGQTGHLDGGAAVPGSQYQGNDGEEGKGEGPEGELVVAFGAPHDDAAADGGDDDADHGGDEVRAAESGAGAEDGLEEQGREEQDGRVGAHAAEVGGVAGGQAGVEDDAARGKGLGGEAHLHEDEDGEDDGGGGEGGDGRRVAPAEVGAAVEADEEGRDGEDESEGAEKVDALQFGEPVTG